MKKHCSIFSSVLTTIFLLHNNYVRGQVFPTAEYDFIIVGGGAAGCLLAARLSEIPQWKVLLLEAGEDENFIQDIPMFASMLLLSSANWGYKSEKSNSFALSMKGGRMLWPQGKVLGGGSVLNDMVYTRGNRKDYDTWEALGNTGWGYDKLLPYFKKFERLEIPQYANDTKYRSTKGEIFVTNPPYHTPLSTAFIQSGLKEGYEEIDFNGQEQIGFSHCQSTMKNGAKFSARKGFLEPAKDRKNLRVVMQSFVTKILINPENKTAYGVKYMIGEKSLAAYASKEVIICAGAINSPQLLMLSGIGPKDHLQELGIPVIQNSKVGYNLKDHVSFINLYFTVNESVSIKFNNLVSLLCNFQRYLKEGDGELTIPSCFEALAFLDVGEKDGFPDIELYFGGLLLPSIPFYLSPLGVLKERMNKFYSPLYSKNGFTVLPILLRPYSKGRILLKNKNPYSKPLIYPNFFSDPRDMKILIEGTKEMINLSKAVPFKKFGTELYSEPLPPCKDHEFGSDSYWECNIRHITMTTLHTVGTCKMGPDSDPDAVVDPELRVRGIQHLRVVGSPVMPTVPSGHTLAPVYMVAEKAADMIKDAWR